MMSEQIVSDDAERRRDEARRLVRRKRIFYTTVGIYLSLSLMWFAIDLLDDSSGYWFYWPMLGTGLGVLITGVVLGGIGGLFGSDWERRQIDRYLRQGDDPDART
jgi:2TM domain-containing protein